MDYQGVELETANLALVEMPAFEPAAQPPVEQDLIKEDLEEQDLIKQDLEEQERLEEQQDGDRCLAGPPAQAGPVTEDRDRREQDQETDQQETDQQESDSREGSEQESENRYYLSCLECLLFVAGRPIAAAEAARVLQIETQRVEKLLLRMVDQFKTGGLQLVRIAGGFQMTTRPEYAGAVARFLQPLPQRLSHSSLETLALIAYRQPLTLPEIEAIRGVKSDSCIRTLLERGLIEDAGRKEVIGRPILYRTTEEFFLYLGINSLSELPKLEAEFLESLRPIQNVVGTASR